VWNSYWLNDLQMVTTKT